MAHLVEESEIISEEIAKLVKKVVIKKCDREKGDFISIFTRRKQPSQFAMAKGNCLHICFRPCQLRWQIFAVDVFSVHKLFLFIRYGLLLSQIKLKKLKQYLVKCSLKCLSSL